jgi:hypothetical protein
MAKEVALFTARFVFVFVAASGRCARLYAFAAHGAKADGWVQSTVVHIQATRF